MNVLVLRFANICFEVHGARAVKRRSARRDAPRSRFSHPLFWKQKAIWNRQHIANVQICCDEEIGTEGRGGYFDQYGACVATRERAIETVFHLRGRIAVSTQASCRPEKPVRPARSLRLVSHFRAKARRPAQRRPPGPPTLDPVPALARVREGPAPAQGKPACRQRPDPALPRPPPARAHCCPRPVPIPAAGPVPSPNAPLLRR